MFAANPSPASVVPPGIVRCRVLGADSANRECRRHGGIPVRPQRARAVRVELPVADICGCPKAETPEAQPFRSGCVRSIRDQDCPIPGKSNPDLLSNLKRLFNVLPGHKQRSEICLD